MRLCGQVCGLRPKQNRREKMGKTKSKDKDADAGEADTTQDKTMEEENSERPPYEELVKQISIISKPLASKKLTKKLFKTIKKGRVGVGPRCQLGTKQHTSLMCPC